ncbi:MAG: undecaprenyl-diphosphate phosphatase [Rhizobacter sp.]|nr:undecaprenyl-diphosphate phosphatase [Chlorobiales bacterium]
MTLVQAILLGIIQGLTEFLPISSTAHIRIIPALLGWPDPGAAFTAVIQIGTLAAVLIYFSRDILRIVLATLKGITNGKFFETPDARMGWMIIIGTIPIVVLGLLFKKQITGSLRSLYVVSAAMIGLAVLLVIAEWATKQRALVNAKQKTLAELGWLDAIAVGFAQCVALIPGASRSGVTITGGLFLGMTRETAARFSFLLSLPSVFAAGVFELYSERQELASAGFANLAVATLVSGIVGYLSIDWLLKYLRTRTTYAFIIYRFIVGIALLVLLSQGWIAAN